VQFRPAGSTRVSRRNPLPRVVVILGDAFSPKGCFRLQGCCRGFHKKTILLAPLLKLKADQFGVPVKNCFVPLLEMKVIKPTQLGCADARLWLNFVGDVILGSGGS
jgi:hypothetical protein